jgi:hypothetical protein
MKIPALFLLLVLGMPSPVALLAQSAPDTGGKRDPFWPVGYRPKSAQPVVTAKPAAKELSEEEMEALVRREQERIRELVAVNGKIMRGNKTFVFINQDLLVTEGDVLEVDVDGVPYRLVIKSLAGNNIQLEPYRQTRAQSPK